MASDPFDEVLNLEERFYREGYEQGKADGARAGKIEGRGLGLEKGYEKFMESGRLYGRSLVWANRLPQSRQTAASEDRVPQSTDTKANEETRPRKLPPLSANPRLEKNVVTLHALVEPDTLATENTDEAVNDFDDRVRRAQGKARIIEKMTGDTVPKPETVKRTDAVKATGAARATSDV